MAGLVSAVEDKIESVSVGEAGGAGGSELSASCVTSTVVIFNMRLG